ncbi:hypothetical protein M378DRAFT_366263 [Amanita muscaria Koide BX008]|uniref:Uncharacterized protein n=1 Tax=Amanita muscaria (strain Koide BX008) TaxID=946122 RepID=A0A0C2W931_AMAMK|nr:hypothetical protein M378DRAFT_366263 [Amanita muscaria Koide BX008]
MTPYSLLVSKTSWIARMKRTCLSYARYEASTPDVRKDMRLTNDIHAQISGFQ